MIRLFIAKLFGNVQLHSKASAIRGDLSAGRQDRPGVWYKV